MKVDFRAFEGSSDPSILMIFTKFHGFKNALFSSRMLKISSSWRVILEASWSKIIKKPIEVCKKCVPQDRPKFDGLKVPVEGFKEAMLRCQFSFILLWLLNEFSVLEGSKYCMLLILYRFY